MIRMILSLVVLAAPAVLLLSSGCSEEKVTTIERRGTIQESEPRMVSPGTEVVE